MAAEPEPQRVISAIVNEKLKIQNEKLKPDSH
jgi:hypothetical protein